MALTVVATLICLCLSGISLRPHPMGWNVGLELRVSSMILSWKLDDSESTKQIEELLFDERLTQDQRGCALLLLADVKDRVYRLEIMDELETKHKSEVRRYLSRELSSGQLSVKQVKFANELLASIPP